MVEPIADIEDLRRHLQWAVEVEHCTIPPYECAVWSVVDPDSAAATSIKYVVREEMLHAALAANILTAVGGRPRFTGDAVPRYPEPMRHHDPKHPLMLHLAPASIELVRDVFLRIERPEEPGAPPEADRYETLAQFYEAIVLALGAARGRGVHRRSSAAGDEGVRRPRRGRAVPRHRPRFGPAGDRGDRRAGRGDAHVGRRAGRLRHRHPPRAPPARAVRVRGRSGAGALLAVPRHRGGQDAARGRPPDARRPEVGRSARGRPPRPRSALRRLLLAADGRDGAGVGGTEMRAR